MEGIVKEIGGRTVIQFKENPGDFSLFGYTLNGREYNGTFVYSAGKVKEAICIGNIITVKEGIGELLTNNQGSVPAQYNNIEVIELLKEIRDLLKESKQQKPKQNSKPTKYNPVTKRDEEYIRIKGIDCFIETDPKEIANGYRYVPCDMGEPGDPKFAIEYGKVNNIPGWE